MDTATGLMSWPLILLALMAGCWRSHRWTCHSMCQADMQQWIDAPLTAAHTCASVCTQRLWQTCLTTGLSNYHDMTGRTAHGTHYHSITNDRHSMMESHKFVIHNCLSVDTCWIILVMDNWLRDSSSCGGRCDTCDHTCGAG